MTTSARKRLSPDQIKAIQTSMQGIVSRSPRYGASRRIFTGEDVANAVPVDSLKKSFEQKMEKVLADFMERIEEQVMLFLATIPRPKNGEPGRTPTETELASIVANALRNISKPETGLSLEKAKDREALLELIRAEAEAIVKKRPTQLGGGGVTYTFQIKDMPNKTRGNGPTYAGNEGKALVVSSDGKSFTFGEAGSSSWQTPPEAVDASNTIFTVSSEPVDVVADGITYFAGQGYSYSNGEITFDLAPSSFVRYR